MSADASPIESTPNKTESLVKPAAEPVSGYGALARRISSRTTDLIAIGIVLIGGLSMGRQLVDWWQTPEPATTSSASDLPGEFWDDPAAALQVEFGDAPMSLARQKVSGDHEAAMGKLVQICGMMVRTAQRPRHEPSAAEAELLAKAAERGADIEEPGVWGVYRLDDRMSVVVGARTFAEAKAGDTAPSRRLICWGTAMPMGADEWGLYTFAVAEARLSTAVGMPEIPLPAGARRSLALRDDRGGGVIGLSGRGDPATWRRHFEAILAAQSWHPQGDWWIEGGTSSTRFATKGHPEAGFVEIQFSGDAREGMSGLIHLLPGRAEAPTAKKASSK